MALNICYHVILSDKRCLPSLEFFRLLYTSSDRCRCLLCLVLDLSFVSRVELQWSDEETALLRLHNYDVIMKTAEVEFYEVT